MKNVDSLEIEMEYLELMNNIDDKKYSELIKQLGEIKKFNDPNRYDRKTIQDYKAMIKVINDNSPDSWYNPDITTILKELYYINDFLSYKLCYLTNIINNNNDYIENNKTTLKYNEVDESYLLRLRNLELDNSFLYGLSEKIYSDDFLDKQVLALRFVDMTNSISYSIIKFELYELSKFNVRNILYINGNFYDIDGSQMFLYKLNDFPHLKIKQNVFAKDELIKTINDFSKISEKIIYYERMLG